MQSDAPLNQTVLISGASSGIGAETARYFAKKKYHVVLLGRNEVRLKEVQAQCGEFSEFLAFDLIDFEKNKESLAELLKTMPPLKILVNNAGVFSRAQFSETSKKIWTEQFQVNFLSVVEVSQFCWPYFIKNQGGSIINIGSTLAVKPTADTGAYSAMKAALQSLTLSLAQAGGSQNIRVNCVNPGIVDTPIHSFHQMETSEKLKVQNQIAQWQLLASSGKPHHIAEAIHFLASEKSAWTTGAILNIDGGINIK